MLKVSHRIKKAYTYDQLPVFIKNAMPSSEVSFINFPEEKSVVIDLRPGKLYFSRELAPLFRTGKVLSILAINDKLRFIIDRE